MVNSMATKLDVSFRLDETLTINAVISDPNGAPADLTGMVTTAIKWGISAIKGGPALVSVQLSAGITIVSAVAGTITIRFEPANQILVQPGTRYYHECKVVHPTWGTSIQFAGNAHVLESIFETLNA
jgi:Ethanolamine utilization protein EutJ (predicted chaperonin)